MSYNKRAKMIKIEQYNNDPKRVGDNIIVSLLKEREWAPAKKENLVLTSQI
jgi:hypothetical protein